MPDELIVTQLEDGTVTIDNDPPPESIVIGRVTWEQMVLGQLDWATVTEDQDHIQLLALNTANVTATFRWLETGPGRTTILETLTWNT
ncbi:hypothetical protein ABZX12_18655 [Kribbella sp. NPDC003505]|uniref:hypothetical protein n=1 Tax=Kribbella sp. NPDC003505 TaxID=3154448 RepID=UPI0033A34777